MSLIKIMESVSINADREKIWSVLLEDETYRKWTAVFHPGSYAESDWKEGSKAVFKTPEGYGLVSKIVSHVPGELISFEHYGILDKGVEVLEGKDIDEWRGARETYTLKEENGKFLLTIEMDAAEKERDFFEQKWKEALGKVKELCES